MRGGAAIAFAMAAFLGANEAHACSPVPSYAYFDTDPVAVEAEVTRVRLVWPREWEQGLVYEADFRLVGPIRSRSLPRYRWHTQDECGPPYPVKRGQRVLLLLEGDPGRARRAAAERAAAFPQGPRPAYEKDYQESMQVFEHTTDLSKVQDLLDLYRPIR